METSNASQTIAHVAASPEYLRPVIFAIGKPGLQVLPKSYLDDLCLDTELTDAGWRVAEYLNGLQIIVRPVSGPDLKTATGRRWLKTWQCYIVDLEARDLDQAVEYGGDIVGFALVAKLGQAITGRRFWTRDENITNL
jgi:hypothetical protein